LGYSRDIYDRAMMVLNRNHTQAVKECDSRKAVFYNQYPRAAEIEQELTATAVKTAKAVLSGGHAKEQLTWLKQQNLSLQTERAQLLKSAGLSEAYLQPSFHCKNCEDEGFIDGRMCSCLKKQMRIEACNKLNDSTPLSLCTFENFSLHYYSSIPKDSDISDYQKMEQILRYCKAYGEQFSMKSPSLFMQGGTGLGKTHLSLAIAHQAIEKDYSVIYGSAQNMVTNLEKERFQKEMKQEDTNELMLECDLLILDDLGTEFTTSFVTAAIYNIINTRLMAYKPTIISTNLSMRELEERYTERFASRILGSYIPLFFRGKDVRQQKRRKKQ